MGKDHGGWDVPSSPAGAAHAQGPARRQLQDRGVPRRGPGGGSRGGSGRAPPQQRGRHRARALLGLSRGWGALGGHPQTQGPQTTPKHRPRDPHGPPTVPAGTHLLFRGHPVPHSCTLGIPHCPGGHSRTRGPPTPAIPPTTRDLQTLPGGTREAPMAQGISHPQIPPQEIPAPGPPTTLRGTPSTPRFSPHNFHPRIWGQHTRGVSRGGGLTCRQVWRCRKVPGGQ